MESIFRHIVCLSIVFVVLNLIYIPAIHAQERNVDFQKFTSESDAIITGKVINKKSAWSDDKSRILTHVQIEVAEYLKGKEGNNIMVTHLGGEIGDVGEIYSHTPNFDDNEEVLIFIKKDSNDSFHVYGGEDGKLTITTDPGDTNKRVGENQSLSSIKNKIKDYMEAR
jgi:hypothetical protein